MSDDRPSCPHQHHAADDDEQDDAVTQKNKATVGPLARLTVDGRGATSTRRQGEAARPPPAHETLPQRYVRTVRRYRPLLELAESGVANLLLYSSGTNNNGNKTELCYALLNLVTFAHNVVYYGADAAGGGTTTTAPPSALMTRSIPYLLRLALSTLDCVQPAVETIARSRSTTRHPWDTIVRLERCKALVRVLLLSSHHYRYYYHADRDGRTGTTPGILQVGGILLPGESSAPAPATTTHHGPTATYQQRLLHGYVGRRTGWGQGLAQAARDDERQRRRAQCAFFVGDLLHVLRPLYYVTAQQRPSSASLLLTSWLVSLWMDLASQRLLAVAADTRRRHDDDDDDRLREELTRRQRRLGLFLLRYPIWTGVTEPAVRAVLGEGRIGTYLLHLLECWQRHHFMLD